MTEPICTVTSVLEPDRFRALAPMARGLWVVASFNWSARTRFPVAPVESWIVKLMDPDTPLEVNGPALPVTGEAPVVAGERLYRISFEAAPSREAREPEGMGTDTVRDRTRTGA